ncbi:putative lipoprotein [Pseudomonas fluorescens]|uniref:Putative lipoprotein n=1 Tax=Pseudomonas fluorescens TaxID=294 RepID=A0A0P8XJU3_PSEFL|nr:putative lipoprotein [Pseudomonas fluorescens]
MRISFMCGLLLTVDCGSHLQSGTQDAEVRRSPSHCFWPFSACRVRQKTTRGRQSDSSNNAHIFA